MGDELLTQGTGQLGRPVGVLYAFRVAPVLAASAGQEYGLAIRVDAPVWTHDT